MIPNSIHRTFLTLFSVMTLFAGAASAQIASIPELQNVDPNGPARFHTVGDKIYMRGSIMPSRGLTNSFQRALTNQVKTLVILEVPGSTDDDAALPFYRLVRRLGLNTHIADNGYAASGGVDLFCAGVNRTVGQNGKLLVHSWSDDQLGEGSQIPLSHPIHQPYFAYYREMGINPAFYQFTLTAPLTTVDLGGGAFMPGMHLVSKEALAQYNLVTHQTLSPPTTNVTTQLPQPAPQPPAFRQPMVQPAPAPQPPVVQQPMIQPAPAPQSPAVQQPMTQVLPPQIQAPVHGLDGTWAEIQNGQVHKLIVINGGQFLEKMGRQVDQGTFGARDNLMSLTFPDGEVEQFFYRFQGGNQLRFADPQTGREINRFYWVRQ